MIFLLPNIGIVINPKNPQSAGSHLEHDCQHNNEKSEK